MPPVRLVGSARAGLFGIASHEARRPEAVAKHCWWLSKLQSSIGLAWESSLMQNG
jgi:hypothetical protein